MSEPVDVRRGRAGAGGADDPASFPAPGQSAIVAAALAIGILLMGVQLWLLAVALELFLAGDGPSVWLLAVVSGAIFLGGASMLAVLDRRPVVRRVLPSERSLTLLLRGRRGR